MRLQQTFLMEEQAGVLYQKESPLMRQINRQMNEMYGKMLLKHGLISQEQFQSLLEESDAQ
jgi:hypothetical protein